MELAVSEAREHSAATSNNAEAEVSGDDSLMWRPISTKNHQLELLRLGLNEKFNMDLRNYHDLHKWSVECYDLFWEFLFKHFQVKCSSPPEGPVVDKNVPISDVPRWFPGVRMNYAENLLRYEDDDKIALYYTSERIAEIGVQAKTFGQLKSRVAFIAAALKAHGVVKGDRVAGYLPNMPEAIEVMAAVASIGAVWSSTSPDFGVSGVLDRFKQISPKLIFSVEAVAYNAKIHNHLVKVKEVVEGLPDLEKVIIIPFVHAQSDIDIDQLDLPSEKVAFLAEFVGPETGSPPKLTFEQVPFHHPLFIMYSSGTTGAPKCMVHSVGGTLMKHLEEHQIQGNRSHQDVLMYYTTIGWMMWNWMVSALALGTTLVLYDGSPLLPHNAAMWDLVDECQITVFGTSAKWIAVQEDRGVKPRLSHKLTSLKAICSTGSPLSPHSYDYVYRDIKSNVLLASISGGTDIIACFMGENSVLPVHRGEIQSSHLGCAIECWNEEGKAVFGEAGELVCTKPFPSMPFEFWNDPEGKLYKQAYFDRFPKIWTHGDFLQINPETKGLYMLGRSDGTLNPNGVRFGSAEIYSITETFPAIADALCVAQRFNSNNAQEERVILFIKLKEGDNEELPADLVQEVKVKIRSRLSARHVPALFLPTKDIPYTVNGKKVEVAVKKILNNQEVKNAGALANPECLELYRNLPEVQKW